MMQFSIVILNYNGLKHLKEFLPSVVETTYTNKRIIIIDNASTDESINWLTKNHPNIELIILDKNYGFTGGYNRGLKNIETDVYILLNNDVKVVENWIEPMHALFTSNLKCHAVQPKILSYKESHLFEYAGACGGYIDYLGYPFTRGRVFETIEKDEGQYDQAQKCFWATGACLFIRANTFKEIGGFDESFFAHQEEIDLCWRIQKKGGEIYVQPQSVVYHLGGGTLQKDNPKKLYLNFRNNLRMLAKNKTNLNLLKIIPIRLILDMSASLKFILGFKFRMALQIYKAYFNFIFWLINEKNIKTDGNYQPVGVLNKSIIKAYYFDNKKKFKDLNDFSE